MRALLICFCLFIVQVSFAQCGYCESSLSETQRVKAPQGNDLAERYVDAQNVKWYLCLEINATMARFYLEGKDYMVVYDTTGTWVATETRVCVKMKECAFKDDEWKATNKNVKMGSNEIFPGKIIGDLKADEYTFKIPKKKLKSTCDLYDYAIMDLFHIELNPKHSFAVSEGETGFYVAVMDGVYMTWDDRKRKYRDRGFYGFYHEWLDQLLTPEE